MKKVRKIKVKPKFMSAIKVMGFFFFIFLAIFLFYRKQIRDLTSVGYSKKASQVILFSFQKDYALSVSDNAALNRVFEEDKFIEEYMEQYKKITYVDQEHFVDHLHEALKKGYKPSDINIIFSHGNDEAVDQFLKRDKINYLEEFFSVDYAKLENYDRYILYSDETGEDEELTVLYVNLDLDKEDYVDASITNDFSLDMLVNKHHGLKEDFVPKDLITIDSNYASYDDLKCSHIAFNAFREMSDAASKEGYGLIINSAYRSYQDQVDISNMYLKSYGQNYVDKYVAKPGFSEHQTGLAFDIGSRSTNVFANSKEYQWMNENAYKYGFIHRFTKRYAFITGFREEAWHYRYVGKDIATKIHELGDISLEEYWAMYIDK